MKINFTPSFKAEYKDNSDMRTLKNTLYQKSNNISDVLINNLTLDERGELTPYRNALELFESRMKRVKEDDILEFKIDKFEPSSDDGAYECGVTVKNQTTGSESRLQSAFSDQLYAVEGMVDMLLTTSIDVLRRKSKAE